MVNKDLIFRAAAIPNPPIRTFDYLQMCHCLMREIEYFEIVGADKKRLSREKRRRMLIKQAGAEHGEEFVDELLAMKVEKEKREDDKEIEIEIEVNI